MANLTAATIRPGTICQAGYRCYLDQNVFVGFTSDRHGWSNNLADFTFYSTYRELKNNVADPGAHFATFVSTEDGGVWQAYRHNGRWCVGSSADALKLAPV